MYILFEDDISCFPFKLLTQLFGDRLHGVLGNLNITNAISKSGNNGIVYVDVAMDVLK